MAIFKEAILLSKEDFLTNVTVFLETGDTTLTVTPKSNQSVILFSPYESSYIQLSSNNLLQIYEVAFKEVKFISGRPYYSFAILNEVETSPNAKSLHKAFYRDAHGVGLAAILASGEDKLHILTDDPIAGRNVEVHFKSNNRVRLFDGKISWSATKQNRHYYELYLK